MFVLRCNVNAQASLIQGKTQFSGSNEHFSTMKYLLMVTA